MLQREVTTEIKKWKETQNHKCLVIRGARQVGKTFTVEHFLR